MVDIIIRSTNEKARSVFLEYNKAHRNRKQLVWRELQHQEFYSFLGILIAAGANNANADTSMDMWKITSYPLYRATMSINRFWNVLRFIRFDELKTRNQRLKNDKLAPISSIWTMMNKNLSETYHRPGRKSNLTVHDQLFPFKGCTGFTRYDPSKPAIYGIKIWWVCDAVNSFPVYGEIDLGEKRNTNKIRPVRRCGKNGNKDSRKSLHRDNLFTSLSSENLREVRIKKKKNNVLKETNERKKVSNTETSGEDDDNLVKNIVNNYKTKSELSTDFRKSHIMDKLLRRFTTHRRTIKWSLALFFNLLDVATFASYIVYQENNKITKNNATQRKTFMRQLSEELCLPLVQERAKDHQALKNFTTRLAIECVLGKPLNESTKLEEVSPRAAGPKPIVGCCYYCFHAEGKKRRKTRQSCSHCARPVCQGHSQVFVKCCQCK